jgi:anaerobic magnesium-protoporphyrin IX monomethyl ester cyclase
MKESNITGIYPPLGIAYLSSYLRNNGLEVSIIDAQALNLSLQQVAETIPEESEIVSFTSTTLIWPNTLKTMKAVKERFPDKFIVVGGPQITAFPKDSLSHEFIDLGIYGEGEETMREVARAYSQGRDVRAIPGTVARKNGRIFTNKPRSLIKDLDQLPFPAIDLLPYHLYRALTVQRPFYTMIASRGCPYRCAFCSQIYFGNRLRLRSAENVAREMEYYVKKKGAKELVMFDETFALDRRFTLGLCRLIRERGLHFRWNIRTRVDTLDREVLEALKGAGCQVIHLGIESGSEKTLQAMRKGITRKQIRKTVHMAQEIGIETRGYFMLGYPGETVKDIRETIKFSRNLGLDWASFTITLPHPRTEIGKEAIKQGLVKKDFWKEFTLGRSTPRLSYFTTKEYDEKDLERWRFRAHLLFYLRPFFLLKKIGEALRFGRLRKLLEDTVFIIRNFR